jgi:hypothetical protein
MPAQQLSRGENPMIQPQNNHFIWAVKMDANKAYIAAHPHSPIPHQRIIDHNEGRPTDSSPFHFMILHAPQT